MLVLTRKTKQSIMIGSNIEITVLKIDRDQVRIGIAAPHDVPVHRKEVFDNIRKAHPESRGQEEGEPPRQNA